MKKAKITYRGGKILSLFVLLLFVLPGKAQEKDFGFWAGFELQKEINKRFDFEVELGHRLAENLTQRDESFLGAGLAYSKKQFATGISYRFTNENSVKRSYELAHRFVWQARYKPEINRFAIDFRIRVQAQYSSINSSENGHLPVSFLRNRIKLSYNIKGIPLEPSISYELFSRINNYKTKGLERQRVKLGFNYKIFKNNEIGVSLIWHETFNVNKPVK
ncbi:MAG: DUF2490 domain-containing protein, partial [Mariniphaga sp.]|nr:DUF2490 domain-containing protein [Mariniphaga sp.]